MRHARSASMRSRVKLAAIALSAVITGAAGALYAQYFLYLDASIAYGTWISVEALLAPIIGGAGTVFGPVIGGIVLHGLSEFTRSLVGRIPGVDLVIFGVLLILVVRFPPRELPGLLQALEGGDERAQIRPSCRSMTSPSASAACWRSAMPASPWRRAASPG